MEATVMPERLVFKKESSTTKEELLEFAAWMQSAHGKGFPIHVMMRMLVNELYSQQTPSFFEKRIPLRVVDFEETAHAEDGMYVYKTTYEASLDGDTVTFSIMDKEENPTVEAITNMRRIVELACDLAVNGLFAPIEVFEEYAELTTYLPLSN